MVSAGTSDRPSAAARRRASDSVIAAVMAVLRSHAASLPALALWRDVFDALGETAAPHTPKPTSQGDSQGQVCTLGKVYRRCPRPSTHSALSWASETSRRTGAKTRYKTAFAPQNFAALGLGGWPLPRARSTYGLPQDTTSPFLAARVVLALRLLARLALFRQSLPL